METDQLGLLLERLDRIESAVATLIEQRASKDWYSTGEVAEIVGKSEYTVREWCRKGQAKADKAPNGRGWLIAHEELQRLRNVGPLPERREN
jgi:transposase